MLPEVTTSKTKYNCKPGLNVYIFEQKCLFRSQDLEIFCLPAVPTEHLDGHRKPHFPMTPHSVLTNAKVFINLVFRFETFGAVFSTQIPCNSVQFPRFSNQF